MNDTAKFTMEEAEEMAYKINKIFDVHRENFSNEEKFRVTRNEKRIKRRKTINTPKEILDLLIDEFIDNIIDMSPEEIEEEMREEYGDSSIPAKMVKEILKKAILVTNEIRRKKNEVKNKEKGEK